MVKEISITLGILVTAFSASYGAIQVFATKAEVRAVAGGVLQMRLDQVERRIFELRREASRRPLTDFEQRELWRLEKLRDQILRELGRK